MTEKPTIEVSGIMLTREGDYVVVKAEIEGKWVEVIREHGDGAFSHIVEPSGMLKELGYYRGLGWAGGAPR